MKKALSLLVTLTLVITMFSMVPIKAFALGSDFDVQNGVLVKYNGTATVVDIPADLGITSIGDSAFAFNFYINSVTIPDSVTSIGDSAFFDCYLLSSITIPSSVTSIGQYSFSYCNALISVIIPNSVTSIGQYSFSNCDKLTSIKLSTDIKSIAPYSFSDCNSLTSIIIPNSVTSIGENAFEGCDSLTSVTLSNGLKLIGICAFAGCYSIKNIIIPNSVTSIDYEAFNGCSELTAITIPSGVTAINDYTFYGCTKLKTVVIPNGLTKFGKYAFYNCHAITSLNFPEGLTTIGEHAFSGCNVFEQVGIPDKVTTIGEYAFSDCTNLKFAYIGSAVKTIGEGAFDENVYLACSIKFSSTPTAAAYVNYSIKLNWKAVSGAAGYAIVRSTSADMDENLYSCSTMSTTYNSASLTSNKTFYFVVFPVKVIGNYPVFGEMSSIISAKTACRPATSVSLNLSSKTMGVGQGYTIYATMSPSNSTDALKWSSSNTAVATVDANGKITAKATGTAKITVKTTSGKTKICTVTVVNAPTSVSLNVTSRTLGKGEKYTLTATLSSGSAGSKTWSSSKTAVATVDSAGKITAVGVGTATITVKTHNGKTAVCTVTVKAAPTSVSLNVTSRTVLKGSTYTLVATLSSGSAGSKTWSSSNTSVAIINSAGKVTAKAKGTAKITVKTYNGKTAICTITVN